MSRGIDLDASAGYLLKVAAVALRGAMEEALRPLGLTVTQYSCLELLVQRPGLSGAQLARGAFVTRQSMHVLLQGLEQHGLVERAATPEVGKALPARVTTEGAALLAAATVEVRRVERRMLAGLGTDGEAEARRVLQGFIDALGPQGRSREVAERPSSADDRTGVQ